MVVNFTGDVSISNAVIGSASQTNHVTFHFEQSSGGVDLNIYDSTLYVDLNGESASARDVLFILHGSTVVNGNITISTPDWSDLRMYDNSTINGSVSIYGGVKGELELHSNTVINGDANILSADPDRADLWLYDPGSTINGYARVYGDIRNTGTITGCAQITDDASSSALMTLNSGSSTGAQCAKVKSALVKPAAVMSRTIPVIRYRPIVVVAAIAISIWRLTNQHHSRVLVMVALPAEPMMAIPMGFITTVLLAILIMMLTLGGKSICWTVTNSMKSNSLTVLTAVLIDYRTFMCLFLILIYKAKPLVKS